ncbi:MAG: GNAT family N-acetyltransferase [Bacteroidia bacterium]|nr:GNAT family N-acetyltransferase [Bacteroidia bacterium]
MRGKTTLLRPIEPADIALLYAWENDVNNWQVSGTLAPYSKDILQNYLQNSAYDIHTTKQIRFIISTTNNSPIGMLDLFNYDPLHQRAGIGILIGNTDYRKQGYATDALQTLIVYSKNTLMLHQLYATIGTQNTASIRLFEALNFKQAGIKKEWIKTPQGFDDEAMYQLLL